MMSVSFLSLELNLKPYRKKIRTAQETLGVLATNLGLEDQLYCGGRGPPPPALPWPGEWAAPPQTLALPHGPASSASAQVSSRGVLTVAFTQRGGRALQAT